MDDGIECNPLCDEQLEEILALFNRIPTDENLQYWKRKYHQTPRSLTLVAKDAITSEVAGFYAIIKWPIYHTGQIMRSFQSVDTIVKDKFRRRRIMVDLANEVYKNARDAGGSFVIGWSLGDRPAWNALVNRLGWYDIGKMTTFAYPIKELKTARVVFDNTILRYAAGCFLALRKLILHPRKPSKISEFEMKIGEWNYEGFTRCWKLAINSNTLTTLKDERFYRNRFKLTRYSGTDFVPISISQDGKIIAFAICITNVSQDRTEGLIADIQAIEGREDAIKFLIWECINYFKSENADYVRLWAKKPDWIVRALVKSGFIRTKSNMRFIILPLSESLPEGIRNFDLWDLSLCDSDHV